MIKKCSTSDAVVLAAAEYGEREALRLAVIRAKIDQGLDDIAAGQVVDGADAFKALRNRFA